MKGLSIQIESGIKTVLEGLNYDISVDYTIHNKEEYSDYLGYNIHTSLKSGKKVKGKLESCDDSGLLIFYQVKDKDGKRNRVDKKVPFKSIIDSRVYEDESDLLQADRMKAIIDSKISSFQLVKDMLNTWVSSPNAPSDEKLEFYIREVVKSGDKALDFLREALAHEIDYDEVEVHKIAAAIKAKPIILSAVFELDSNLRELRDKLESGDLSLKDKEFKIGYPERFAKGEFYTVGNYWKRWYNKVSDAVRICPFSTSGSIITLEDLRLQLPKEPEDKTKILFHDLPKKEQYWRRQHVPPNITPQNADLWDEYIKEEFRRRREGVWFMNNGEAVYITGNHYFALQWCQMLDNGGYMDFRYAQLYMFYHLEACIIDNRCLGQIFLKSRRTGFTYVVLSILLNMSTGKRNGKYGMTSKSGDDVEEVWMKFSYMFLNLPFFFRPVVKGKEDSPNELFFGMPSDNSKKAKKSREMDISDYLNTNVDQRPTKNDSYDSVKLDAYLGDEAYKWRKPHDYIVHLGMISPTMMPAGKVVGKAFIGSTMGAQDKGGEQGVELINGSLVKDRDEVTGKTSTGLYFYFLAAQDNMEEFTDKYGKCWTEKPPRGTKNVLGETIKTGSIEYLLAVEEQKRRQSDKALNEQLRTYPRTKEHAMRDESDNTTFNITKLYEQLDYNHTLKDEVKYTVGNFEWEGAKDGDVVFQPNPNGRFKVNWMPSAVDGTESLQNRVRESGGKFFPLNMNFVRFGCDPFSYKSTHGKGSKGSIHGKTVTLPDGGAPSNRFILEYIARPEDEFIFFEDVIKMVRFYGSPILVESNKLDLLRHLYLRGYRAFCIDRLDRPKHKLNPNERQYGGQLMSGQDIIESHISAIGTWIQDYVGIYSDEVRKLRPIGEMGDMPFNETLKDWLAFNPDKRTEYDATISSGLCIMACNEERYKPKKVEKKRVNINSVLNKYSNKGSRGARILN